MPKIVDHDKRREQIIEGLIRLIASQGMHQASLRAVAQEADVSLRSVQYYFDDKAALMQAALHHLEKASHDRWNKRLATLTTPYCLRDYLLTFIQEALPSDPESRIFHLVWTSFAILAQTDTTIAKQPFLDGPKRIMQQIEQRLTQGRENEEISTSINPAFEAKRLVALCHGLGASLLVGLLDADEAVALATRHVDELFQRKSTEKGS